MSMCVWGGVLTIASVVDTLKSYSAHLCMIAD